MSEEDVRGIVRLLGDVAAARGGGIQKKRLLMDGLAKLVEADDWVWSLSPEMKPGKLPVHTAMLHSGLSEERFSKMLVALSHPEMGRLTNPIHEDLKANNRHLTRSRQHADPDGFFEVSEVGKIWGEAGLTEVMLSFRPMAGGEVSSVALFRRPGRPPFSQYQIRMAHVVLTEVAWLHEMGWPEDRGVEVPKLSPRRRTVLNLVLEGMARKEMAGHLGISIHTLDGYVKDIFRHFGVHSQIELISRFRRGDGNDTP